MRPSSLTLIAAGLLLSSTVAAHEFQHPAAKHRMILQVRQDDNTTTTTAAPTTTVAATTSAVVSPTTTSTSQVTSTSAQPTTSSTPTTTSTSTTSEIETTSSAPATTTSAAPTTTSAAPTSTTPTSTSVVAPTTLSRATTATSRSSAALPGLVTSTRGVSTSKVSATSAATAASSSSGLSSGATAGIVIGVLVGAAALGFFIFRKVKLAKSKKFNRRLQPLDFSGGGMPDEHEFKTTEGAFAAGEKRGDSEWDRRERERSDLVAGLDDNDPAYANSSTAISGIPDHDFTAAYPAYPPTTDPYGYPPQGQGQDPYASNGYENPQHPTSYYGDNTAGFGAGYGAYGSTEGAGVQRQPSNGGVAQGGEYGQEHLAYDQQQQQAYGAPDQGVYGSPEQQQAYGVQRQPSNGGAAGYDAYNNGGYNYQNPTDYPPQQPQQGQQHQQHPQY